MCTHLESRVYSIGQTEHFISHLYVIETNCVTEFKAVNVNVNGEDNSLGKACACTYSAMKTPHVHVP